MSSRKLREREGGEDFDFDLEDLEVVELLDVVLQVPAPTHDSRPARSEEKETRVGWEGRPAQSGPAIK